jgi:hypothetical protein
VKKYALCWRLTSSVSGVTSWLFRCLFRGNDGQKRLFLYILLTMPKSSFRILFIEFTAILCSVVSFQIDFRGSLSVLAATRLMVAAVRFSPSGLLFE